MLGKLIPVYPVHPAYRIIRSLDEDNKVTYQEIAENVELSRPSVTRIIKLVEWSYLDPESLLETRS